MLKKVDSKSKVVLVEMFNITAEATKYYPTGSSKSNGAVPAYRRPKSSGGNQRFSSFKKA